MDGVGIYVGVGVTSLLLEIVLVLLLF